MANLQNALFSLRQLCPGFSSALLLALSLCLIAPTQLSAAPLPLAIQTYLEDQQLVAKSSREIELLTGTDRGGALTILPLKGGGQVHVLQVGLSAHDVFRFYHYDQAGQLTTITEIQATFPWNADKGELEYGKPQLKPAKAVKPDTQEWSDWKADATVLSAIASGASKSRDISESIIRK